MRAQGRCTHLGAPSQARSGTPRLASAPGGDDRPLHEPRALTGATSADIAADFPGLGVLECRCAVPGAETRPVRRRLAARLVALARGVDGARAAASRTHPVPSAYRALARQVGLDPDADGLPLEALLLERLLRGALPSGGPVPDACAIAVLETGVPVWPLDPEAVYGPLRLAVHAAGALAVADDRGPLVPLLADPPAEVAAAPTAQDVLLFAVRPGGVPEATVREALWLAAGALEGVA